MPNCGIALNRGNTRRKATDFYQPDGPHGRSPRIWGPSSCHPGNVIHGFADAHTQAISDNNDADVYFAMCNALGK